MPTGSTIADPDASAGASCAPAGRATFAHRRLRRGSQPALGAVLRIARRSWPERNRPSLWGRPAPHSRETASPTTSTETARRRPALQLDPSRCSSRPPNRFNSETGLIQRARLLELILTDLYGGNGCSTTACFPRHSSSRTPASCGRATTSSCRQSVPAISYSANLAAATTASGASSATAPRLLRRRLTRSKRIVMTRTLPEAFRDCRVNRLRAFLPGRSATRSAPSPRETRTTPASLLLTPGPYNETYSEHAYLAR